MTEIPKRIRVIRSVAALSGAVREFITSEDYHLQARETEHFYTLEDKQMTQEEPKTMTGLEALAYLIQKPSGNCVHDKTCPLRLTDKGFQYFSGSEIWQPWGTDIRLFLSESYTPCPDPSKPVERKEDEYTEKRRKFVLFVSDYHGNRTLIEMILEFVEAEFQRKEVK